MATRWFPDTCDCVLIYQAEGDDLTCQNVEHRCELHADIEDPQELLEAVRDHNRSFATEE